METIPLDQLERIRPIVDAVRDTIAEISIKLPDDAPTAADYQLPE